MGRISKHTTAERRIESIWIHGINGDQSVYFSLKSTRFLILHGRNGSGKTQALRIIESILNVNILVLSYYSFTRADISFEDGTHLSVGRSDVLGSEKTTTFVFVWGTEDNKSIEEIRVNELEATVKDELSASRVNDESFYWEIESEYNFLPRHQSEVVDSDAIQETLNSLKTTASSSPKTRGILSRIAKVRATLTGVHCQFIGTHRLVAGRSFHSKSSVNLRRFLPIEHLATRMQEYIKVSLKDSNEIRAKFDTEFPQRIFEIPSSASSPFVDIIDLYENIDDKRKRIQEELGVELGTSDFFPQRSEPLNPLLQQVALFYFKGQQDQLKPLEDLLGKVSVFKRLINERLWRKSISVSMDLGLQVHSTDDHGNQINPSTSIPLEKLSTGEQHEIYLFFNLVFADDNPSLILIDEPEISLHVAWQRTFIDDILEASQFTSPRFIIATHSPQVIGSRQDQLVTFIEPRI